MKGLKNLIVYSVLSYWNNIQVHLEDTVSRMALPLPFMNIPCQPLPMQLLTLSVVWQSNMEAIQNGTFICLNM